MDRYDKDGFHVAYCAWYVHPSRCGIGLKLRTVRTKTHKCTFELDSGAGELYDLSNDPEESVRCQPYKTW